MDSALFGTLMVIDDTPANLDLLESMLTSCGHRVLAFTQGKAALDAARLVTPDLILLDVSMPGMDGFEVCSALKAMNGIGDIPILFISARSDTEAKTKAFRMGGVDYITKPFQLDEVRARVDTHLRIRFMQRELITHNHYLENLVEEKTREATRAHLATIETIAQVTEYRDRTTGNHVRRIQHLCRRLALGLREFPELAGELTDGFIDTIFYASALHDIGKIMVSDAILLKPGPLTVEEFEEIKTHSELGAKALEIARATCPGNDLLDMGVTIARSHHERWDGKGYPQGISKTDIPLSARIMALVDVYDALRSDRHYKPPFTHERAMAIIMSEEGTHFDPRVVKAFRGMEDEVKELDYSDTPVLVDF